MALWPIPYSRATRLARSSLCLFGQFQTFSSQAWLAPLRRSERRGSPSLFRSTAHSSQHGNVHTVTQTISSLEGPDQPDPLSATPVIRSRMLQPPSAEQQVAIDTLLHSKNNLIIDACAGSGKTTTILHLAKAAPEEPFLVFVYNRRLMVEMQQRAKALGISNLRITTYHAFGNRHYTPECATDQGLKRICEDDMPVLEGMELPDFSVLVMDEQQDMTPILKRFVDKVIRDKGFNQASSTSQSLRVVVLGDKRQEVYGFNNADSRFLTMAARPEIFGYLNSHAWVSASQTTSNRITQQNVDFINQQMLKTSSGTAMRAVRKENEHGVAFPRPRYVICDPYEDVLDEVLRLLTLRDILPTDIIVLAPSVRGMSPTVHLANRLALRGVPVFRSDSDVSDIAPEVAQGKVLICTYHQAKGIERKASIVLGFDQTYHTWYDKVVKPPTVTSNPQYVAATRALEHLIVVHDYLSPPLPFVDLDTVERSCDLAVVRPREIKEPKPARKIRPFNVTGLCRNLSETLITACLERLQVRLLAMPALGVQPAPPTEVEDRAEHWEGVSNVTGTAVPAIFQWRKQKTMTILAGLRKYLKPPSRRLRRKQPLRDLPPEYFEKLREIAKAYDDHRVLSTDDILYLSTFAMADMDEDITKLLAIPLHKYNWLTEAHCKDIQYTLSTLPDQAKVSGRGIRFEYPKLRKFPTITHGGGPTNPGKKKGVIVRGAMDISRPDGENKIVWEIKNSDSLQPENLLQVALYMLLLGEPALGFLVSSRTGQVVQVIPRHSGSLMEILQLLVDAKSGGEQTRLLNTYSDEEFLAECRQNFTGLVGKCALPAWFAMRPSGSKFHRHKVNGNELGQDPGAGDGIS